MANPIDRAAKAFANLSGRRNAEATESKATDDDEVMDEEEAEASEAEEDSGGNNDAMDDQEESKAEDEEKVEDEDKAAKSADYQRGADDMKARISAIMASEEAVGREASAFHLAMQTNLSVEDAEATLAGIDRKSSKSNLDHHMAADEIDAGIDAGRGVGADDDHGWGKAISHTNRINGRKK